MTDTTTAAPTVSRPTAKSEWTLIGTLVAGCVLAFAFGATIAFGHWPESVAGERIHYLGWALLLSIGFGVGLVVVAIISPSVGTVKASGMGADLEINGKSDA